MDGSPHGGEESGGDASLKVLYDLAARTDCAAEQILDDAIVIVVPIYNPDGRDVDQRRNLNGFDMNRDWFARTQPEIDGVIELMRQYPPQLAIDALERDDTSVMERLLAVLERPYDEQPAHQDLAARRPEWARQRPGCSALSCSS